MMKTLYALLFLLVSTSIDAAVLFCNGKTDYTIVVATEASVSEKTAAAELQTVLFKIGGARFEISSNLNANGNIIYIGFNSKVENLTGRQKPSETDESFTYQAYGNDIVIYGGSQRGTLYGVYSFLENELGVRWYTAEFTKIPKRESWSFKSLKHSETPFIPFRYTMYYRCGDDMKWSARNKDNYYWVARRNEYGGQEACMGAHTLATFIPAEEFFGKHPEYFALRDGKRKADAQICLSNRDVLKIVTKRVLKRIKENPDYEYYDVSQLDNYLFCECENCRKIENKYGGEHSGIIVWFVNQVAETIGKQYPDKKLCTLAYLYSRHAPKNIRPRANVVIRLCSFECCFAHPIEDCPENQGFLKDLKAWSELTQNLFIWDYVVNFGHYLTPFPNFGVLARNIKTFRNNGARIVLEQGQRESYGGEFGEMKAWVLSKLLWNPNLDTERLVKEFIKDYYGSAAPEIQKYYNLCRQTITQTTHIYQDKDPAQLFSESFVSQSRTLLDKALAKAKGEDVYRVEDVRAQILYLQTQRSKLKSEFNGNNEELRNYLQKHKTFVRENLSAEKYLQSKGYI